MNRSLTLQTPHGPLHGHLEIPGTPRGLILLARAHHAAIDTAITAHLAARGYAMFSMELLSTQEAQFADATQNVPRLAQRLIDILDLIRHDGDMQDMPLAILATGDVSPAAVRAAAQRDTQVLALACHGGLIDRAGKQSLEFLTAPLLVLGDPEDDVVKSSYDHARPYLTPPHEFHTLTPAEDPVLRVAAWFTLHLHT